LELALEALEQREGIGRASGKAGEDLAVVEPAHLAGIALHDGVAERDLPVAAHRNRAIAANSEDRGAMWIERRRIAHVSSRSKLRTLHPSTHRSRWGKAPARDGPARWL